MTTEEQRPRTRTQRARAWARDVLLVLVAFSLVHVFQTRGLAAGTAPAFSRVALAGEHVRVPTPGARRVVHFFATWCGVCKAEEHNLTAIAAEGDVLFVASASGTAEEVRRYARARGLTMPIVVDDGRLARAYGVRAYPTTFFVDGSGEIDFSVVGYTTELGLRARRFFTR
jgi:thiol-disulfide isomerase/thioredoxin